ncbi:hypothetical protein [Pantoea coffeiphila]|uniref:hypothetical protein n=1 Tax=Pantoea coffeiphila TaxID=1465635 RepID=UPI001960B92A|nr:hypothetical protein [Pantoea coffeiphila]MBM7343706.1 hypothetical protein [Pantoea coffeiphila]
MAQTLARRIVKVLFYIVLSLIIARTLGTPENWLSDKFYSWLGHLIYGSGEIGADNYYDLYFYVSVITVFSITTLVYFISVKLIKTIRNI